MERTIGRDVRIIVLVAIVYLAASMLIENQYYQLMLTLVPVWAMLGIAWNVFSGYSGMVSFGHASFFGLGAYTVTLLLVKLDVSPWCGIPIGMVVGGIAGALIGWPTFRLRGHYFALAMLAYPLALLYIFEWLGFQEVSLPMKRASPAAFMQFQDYRWYVAIALVMLVIAMAISLKIERSRFGLALLAIKQNEPAAEAAGINTRTWKIRALMVSGAIAAGIGGFYAVVLLIVTPPSVFGMLTSAQALIVTLFGGVATVWGPVVGSAILIPLAEVLQAELGDKIPGIQGVVFGVAIVLVILLAPEGIVPHLREALRRRRAEGTAGSAASTVLAAVHQPPAMTEHAKRTVSEDVVLKVEGLCRAFGGLKAVEDVSFDVRKGEVLGIIGPNGAGKTTLFNLLNGFLPPNAGQVIWANENLVGMRPNEICRRGIGRTFQVVRPFQRMTVLQNVVVGAFVAESDDEKALALAGEALARVGMADRAGALAGGLTHVELRLTELARALASRPQLLLLDETLAGLGSQEVERLLTVIDGLARGGATIVIIEHTMQAMVRLADRFVVLDHGRIRRIEGAGRRFRRGRRGPVHRDRRSERRRQDHALQGDLRNRPTAFRERKVRRQGFACHSSRGACSPGNRARSGGAPGLQVPDRAREPRDGGTLEAWSRGVESQSRADPGAFSDAGRASRSACGDAFRRRAADAVDRPGSRFIAPRFDARRTVDGPCTDHRRSDLRADRGDSPRIADHDSSGRAARG